MQTFQDQLSAIAKEQGYTVNEIVQLCDLNKAILSEQKVSSYKYCNQRNGKYSAYNSKTKLLSYYLRSI